MLDLVDYSRMWQEAQTLEALIGVPPPEPQPMDIAYHKLRGRVTDIYHHNDAMPRDFKELFSSDFTFRDPLLEPLCPLSMTVLEAKAAAGVDLHRLSFKISVTEAEVVLCDPWDWHVDAKLMKSNGKRAALEPIASGERFGVSNIAGTFRLATQEIINACPVGVDPILYHFCVIAALEKKRPFLPLEEILQQHDPAAYGGEAKSETFLFSVRNLAKEIVQHAVQSPPSHLMEWGYLMLHALGCEPAAPWQDGEMRMRATLSLALDDKCYFETPGPK